MPAWCVTLRDGSYFTLTVSTVSTQVGKAAASAQDEFRHGAAVSATLSSRKSIYVPFV